MSPRERTLLVLLFIALAAAALLVGLGTYFDRLTALDSEFVSLQKRAVQESRAGVPAAGSADGRIKARFLPAGPLPNPLQFASLVQDTLRETGMRIVESRVLPEQTGSSWVQFQAEGTIDGWFRFLGNLRSHDAKALFRSLSLVHRSALLYAVTFEVGHVILP